MKRFLSIFLAGMMIFVFSACGSNSTVGDESPALSTTDSTSTEASNSTSENTDSDSQAITKTDTGTKALIVYFSWSSSHNTQTMAEYIADATNGELFRLEPKTPYTTDYNAVIDVAQEEQRNNARPEIAKNITQEQLDSYDVIFVGYPVWWYDTPMIIYSFMESLDFSDKTVVTFATSGGSGISDSELKAAINANFLDGLCIANFSAGDDTQSRVNTWVEELGYLR